MDDADHAMQAELASQAGSVAHSDKMELEQEDSNTVRDAEMEIHDIAAEGTIEDMKAATASDDAEMNAEMLEQEHMQAERDWKDADADVDVVPLDGDGDGHDDVGQPDGDGAGEATTPTAIIEAPVSHDVEASEQLEDANEAGDGIADSETGNVDAVTITEEGQQTLEETLGVPVADPHAAMDNAQAEVERFGPPEDERTQASSTSTGALEKAEPARERDPGDNYADADEATEQHYEEAYEPVPSTSAVLVEDFHPAAISSSRYRRPALQRDYLAHVEVFSGEPPSLKNGSTGPAAPHVSLVYNNEIFSLFRPSSIPSGDDETVVFGEDEDQQLYYSSLDTFIGKLHEAFPHFRGDGDNELILDFGILDMQISEDNVYTQQLSLHDFDRIRVGMGQPELDRLQITLLIGKRFVYKFNELAEHVYRMHAGSEYDSDTIYDETAEDEENIPEYFEEGAAEEDAFRTAEEANAAETEADDARLAAEDAALPEDLKPDALVRDEEERVDEEEEEPIEYPDDEEGEQGDGAAEENGPVELEEEEPEEGQEIHPPTDEYYEDPEFSQHVVDENEEDAYYAGEDVAEAEAVNEEGDGSETVQDYTEFENGENGEGEEAQGELAIHPNAPLDEVVEQIEEFQEETFEQEEDAAAEAKAARHDEPIASTTSVNVEAIDKDTERIYAGMDSLAAEQQGRVDPRKEPTSAIDPELPVKRTNSTGKRSRDEEVEGVAATNGQIGDSVADALTNDDHTKRPRVSPEA